MGKNWKRIAETRKRKEAAAKARRDALTTALKTITLDLEKIRETLYAEMAKVRAERFDGFDTMTIDAIGNALFHLNKARRVA